MVKVRQIWIYFSNEQICESIEFRTLVSVDHTFVMGENK